MTILAEGTIPATRAMVFKSGAEGPDFRTDVLSFDKVKITKITIFNKTPAQQTVILYIRKKFGELRKLRQYMLQNNESVEYLQGGEFLSLQPGDELEAETSDDDSVDFTVYGELS